MASGRLSPNGIALILLGALLLGVLVGPVREGQRRRRVVEVRARMPERGGFLPDTLRVRVGEPFRLRLVSDDVVHGFAVGGQEGPAVVLYPGKPVDVTLTFDQPGTYTFYCTRWCGPNHWRMRGTIIVEGPEEDTGDVSSTPLFVQLGLDIDAPHPASVVPPKRPSASRGARWAGRIPAAMATRDYYVTHSPEEAWQALRNHESTAQLTDEQVWDLVAYLWSRATTAEALAEGARLYAQQCAACHGEQGRGDGPFAPDHLAMPDFTDPSWTYGASPALWQGKILRGGMGTTMPSWGRIFTESQIWALTDFLWTFSMDLTPELPSSR